jgi:hypothetical protein
MTRPEIKNKNQMQKRKMNFTLVGKRRSLSARATSSLSSTKKRILSILTFEGEKTYRTLIGFKHIIQINTPHRRGGKRRKCGQIDHKSSRISVEKNVLFDRVGHSRCNYEARKSTISLRVSSDAKVWKIEAYKHTFQKKRGQGFERGKRNESEITLDIN